MISTKAKIVYIKLFNINEIELKEYETNYSSITERLFI